MRISNNSQFITDRFRKKWYNGIGPVKLWGLNLIGSSVTGKEFYSFQNKQFWYGNSYYCPVKFMKLFTHKNYDKYSWYDLKTTDYTSFSLLTDNTLMFAFWKHCQI